ncbi:MAG: glucokinase [Deltaproteobacteria bacterium]|nr:glucokinase [Deltaproteobacteria bacterium]MDL1961261.1 glucokinase [Deltaproteobacteria bacterium]
MKVLAGDIGGTNARFAIIEGNTIIFEKHYPSRDFDKFEDVFAVFVEDVPEQVPLCACLAVAGVVEGNRVEATNIPWTIDGNDLKKRFGLETLRLINDFEAAARGITVLHRDHLIQIGGGKPISDGPKAMLGAGTGLGQAILAPCNKGYKVLPTEGGHVDFAPRNEEEIRLLRYLMKEFPHVSVERILSGPGLVNIYKFLLEERDSKESVFSKQSIKEKDKAAHITRHAVQGTDDLCQQTVSMFCSIYGAEAGNLALKCLATGGVYVAGGIAPKILPILSEGGFRQAFESKGRMEKVLKHIPTYIVISPQLGLLGAALMARQ